MLAAIGAAEAGARVTLLERGPKTGRKLRLTGKGRCNITNTAGVERFIRAFGPNGRFLYGAFSRFFRDDILGLLDRMGVPSKAERGGRVFPTSDSAVDVAEAIERRLADLGVDVRPNARVKSLIRSVGPPLAAANVAPASRRHQEDGAIRGVMLYHGTMDAGAVIVATGGLSYPGTGSTGDGYMLAREVGHTIVPTRPALAPMLIEEPWVRGLSGLALKNVAVKLLVGDQPEPAAAEFGEMLFTHTGVSGPIVLTVSRYVPLPSSGCTARLAIDLKPALTHEQLHERLIRDFASSGKLGPYVRKLMPHALADTLVGILELDAARSLNQVTGADRRRLVSALKGLPLSICGLAPIEEAIVTAGGVALNEVDPRTMMSRKADGLFLAGEVLDLDAETGGYNLQAAFSTGWVAGSAAAAWVLQRGAAAREPEPRAPGERPSETEHVRQTGAGDGAHPHGPTG